ncbi:MAG TPA: hypothetical protein VHW45_18965 [Candidatus Sulfotelmatobacter sp.]|jgi:hypothetical protein|nr:hypothetical protein [Candidatus Sulfotelmatobacter sp.]
MRIDTSFANSGPSLDEPSQECPTAGQLVDLFQTANQVNWEQRLPKLLGGLGVAHAADLTPTKLAEFRDQVFWSAKQAGIKEPAGWISHRAQLKAKEAAANLRCPADAGKTAVQPRAAESKPVALENSRAIIPAASVLPSGPRTALYGTTKAEVLARAKAAVEARKSRAIMAEILACAQKDFHASQREIGRATGLSASKVCRLLKWRQSGDKHSSPYGPTTRAARAAHRKNGHHDAGERRGAEQPKNDGSVGLVEHSLPSPQSASPTPLKENPPSASAQNEVLSGGAAAKREAEGVEEEVISFESGGQQSEERKLSARYAKLGQKLSPERMLIILGALKEHPILFRAAAKAEIHRKTLELWLKSSRAGQDGYDIEWEGFPWRFHEAVEAAVGLARWQLRDAALEFAMGPITYKIDQDLVDLGMEGLDAYARDDNGELIEEARGPGNNKMIRFVLQTFRPEKWGKSRKRKSLTRGGVLVIGEGAARSETNCTASVEARQWKSTSRRIEEIKAKPE